jgi:hypothetical protein
MKNLRVLYLLGGTLMFGVAPVVAQNTVDVLDSGPQPANTIGCAAPGLPNCIPATWSTTSNAGADITMPITNKYFVFDTNGGATFPTDFPTATTGNICLADTRELTGTTLFGQIATNVSRGGVTPAHKGQCQYPSTIPVFTISTANGDF